MFGWLRPKGRVPETLTYDQAKKFARHADARVRRELAEREDLAPEILYYLAEDKRADVRQKIASNTTTPRHADLLLARDEDDDVRTDLALKIGRLVPGLSDQQNEKLLELTFQILTILAQDQLPRVRQIIAEEIKAATNAPKDVVKRLARDVELIVAAPILEYSPLLSDSDLLELIAAGIADGGLAVISKRRKVSDKVAKAIVAANDIPAVAALLRNPNAQVREDTLDRIIEQAEKADSLHEPLAHRSDLSMGAIRRIAGFVSTAILDVLRREHELDADTARHVTDAVKRRIKEEQDSMGTSVAERVAALHAQGRLNEDAVIQAADQGQRGFVSEALALRAGVPVQIVNQMLDARSGKAVTAIAWKAGLTARGAMQLQRQVARVPANAMINARDGVNYALTESEMDWFLTYFREEADRVARAA